jgi:hypothetical protein
MGNSMLYITAYSRFQRTTKGVTQYCTYSVFSGLEEGQKGVFRVLQATTRSVAYDIAHNQEKVPLRIVCSYFATHPDAQLGQDF